MTVPGPLGAVTGRAMQRQSTAPAGPGQSSTTTSPGRWRVLLKTTLYVAPSSSCPSETLVIVTFTRDPGTLTRWRTYHQFDCVDRRSRGRRPAGCARVLQAPRPPQSRQSYRRPRLRQCGMLRRPASRGGLLEWHTFDTVKGATTSSTRTLRIMCREAIDAVIELEAHGPAFNGPRRPHRPAALRGHSATTARPPSGGPATPRTARPHILQRSFPAVRAQPRPVLQRVFVLAPDPDRGQHAAPGSSPTS